MNVVDFPPRGPRAADARDWSAFLRPLAIAEIPGCPSREAFAGRCASIAFALPNVPAEMLTEWRQREALARFKFFPTAAEIAEWLAPDLKARRETADLKALPAPKPEPRGPRTIEELTAVRAKVQEFMAERNKAADGSDLPPVEPRYLSEGHLIAALERQAQAPGPFGALAKLRLSGLRAKQGAQA